MCTFFRERQKPERAKKGKWGKQTKNWETFLVFPKENISLSSPSSTLLTRGIMMLSTQRKRWKDIERRGRRQTLFFLRQNKSVAFSAGRKKWREIVRKGGKEFFLLCRKNKEGGKSFRDSALFSYSYSRTTTIRWRRGEEKTEGIKKLVLWPLRCLTITFYSFGYCCDVRRILIREKRIWEEKDK